MRQLAERLARSQRVESTGMRPEELWIRCEASVGAVHRVVAARIVQGQARDLPGLAIELGGLVRALAAVG
jgi:hypothetical protein